jgi:hypothetical protein
VSAWNPRPSQIECIVDWCRFVFTVTPRLEGYYHSIEYTNPGSTLVKTSEWSRATYVQH